MPFDPLQEATTIVGEREFYVLDFGVSVEYFTSYHRPVTESDLLGMEVTWTPVPILRKEVKKRQKSTPDETRIILPVTPSFISIVAQSGLDEIGLTVIRGFGDDYANDYRSPWWVGYVFDITVGINTVTGNLKTVEALFDDVFPKVVHGPGCNNDLFGPVCGLNPASFIRSQTVTDIQSGGRIVVVDGTIPPNDTDTFGRMRLPGEEVWRHVTQQAGLQYVLHIPITGLQIGDTVEILPGCAKRVVEDCTVKYSNKPNNVSMALVPEINPVIDGF